MHSAFIARPANALPGLLAACAYAADYLRLVLEEKQLGSPGRAALEKLNKAIALAEGKAK